MTNSLQSQICIEESLLERTDCSHQSSTNDVNVMFSDVCKSLISLYSNREQQKPTQKQIDHFRYLYNAWLEVENKKKKAEFMWSLRQG